MGRLPVEDSECTGTVSMLQSMETRMDPGSVGRLPVEDSECTGTVGMLLPGWTQGAWVDCQCRPVSVMVQWSTEARVDPGGVGRLPVGVVTQRGRVMPWARHGMTASVGILTSTLTYYYLIP